MVGYDNPDRAGTPLFATDLTGGGVASIDGVRTIGSGANAFYFVQIGTLYPFRDAPDLPSATPEPATLLLLLTGSSFVASRRRRR